MCPDNKNKQFSRWQRCRTGCMTDPIDALSARLHARSARQRQCLSVVRFQRKYRLVHPENYLFSVSPTIFSGLKYPNKHFTKFWKKKHSCLWFRNHVKPVWDTLIQKRCVQIIKMNDFPGDNVARQVAWRNLLNSMLVLHGNDSASDFKIIYNMIRDTLIQKRCVQIMQIHDFPSDVTDVLAIESHWIMCELCWPADIIY